MHNVFVAWSVWGFSSFTRVEVTCQAADESTCVYTLKIAFLLCLLTALKLRLLRWRSEVVENLESAALKRSSLRWTHNVWSVIQKDVVDCERKKARRKSCNKSANNCCTACWRIGGSLLCCHHQRRCQFGLLSLQRRLKSGHALTTGWRWKWMRPVKRRWQLPGMRHIQP